ncbi:hypothetical protein EUTSA_v10009548mg [Eutrema salsugineum]|uniref:F-box domain-containing protein n=2 Tax=Eutrema salsugineum TaxID=72664 RepID=V4K7N5_EUTSA|nr:hypothetical protein EUTSA_v10009548mg [Eutrema salsugineum]
MENKEKLAWDLIEEILSRVSPKSLVRFRIVSKQWNALINDKTFINSHKKTFRFILTTKSKIYSASIDPKIEVRELTLDIPGLESQEPKKLIDCNGFLLCVMDKGAVVWNPWLRQTRWIEPEVNQPNLQFNGIGYDKHNGYKTFASYRKELDPTKTFWKFHDLSSDAWKDQSDGSSTQEGERCTFLTSSGVTLDGTLYWVGSFAKTQYLYLFFLLLLDSSTDKFYKFCDLPCLENHNHDAIVLQVFRGERFSLLKQCSLTKKIEIWVTKNKIHKWGGRDVEWMSFMEVSIPSLPDLVQAGSYSQPSYFIDDKRLVVCSCDETGWA